MQFITYNGQHSYKTRVGATLSLIFFIIMIGLTAQKLADVFTRKIVSVTKEFVPYETSAFSYNPAPVGF